jgi:hypothetical protein
MNKITVYSYDPDTGRYDGNELAYEDPLEKGNYMFPANTTTSRPPESKLGDNQFYVWKDNSWQIETEEPLEEPEEEKLTPEELLKNVRRERDSRLNKTDYLLLEDSPLTLEQKSLLKVYRQALRDMPSNVTDPENPVWPEKPF